MRTLAPPLPLPGFRPRLPLAMTPDTEVPAEEGPDPALKEAARGGSPEGGGETAVEASGSVASN